MSIPVDVTRAERSTDISTVPLTSVILIALRIVLVRSILAPGAAGGENRCEPCKGN